MGLKRVSLSKTSFRAYYLYLISLQQPLWSLYQHF